MIRQKIIDLLAMSRFANLPTVWSNGLLGVLIGWIVSQGSVTLDPTRLLALGLALSGLYLGGCFFNDWHDVEFDRKTRPDRAIPSGRWSRQTIFILSATLMGGGVLVGAWVSLLTGLFSIGILLCILAYTKWHKVNPASFVFMAGARALIYPAAAFSLVSSEQLRQFRQVAGHELTALVLVGLGLGGYILGISLTARAETSPNPLSEVQKNLPVACLCAPLLFFSGPLLLAKNGFALIPLFLFIAVAATQVRRLRATHEVGVFVSRALAAIPLVDYLWVFPLAAHPSLLIVCPLLALAALGLQKIAPAT